MAKQSKKKTELTVKDATTSAQPQKTTKSSATGFQTWLRSYQTELGIALGLLVCIAIVYGNVVTFGFVDFDDLQFVIANAEIKKGFTQETIKWAFTTTYASNYWMPVSWFSHILDWSLFGSNAGGHHFTNVLFHAANTLLLFGLLRYLTGQAALSGVVAFFFAVHPMQVEPVAWVAARKDLICTFFGFLTLWAYVWFAQPKRNWLAYGLTLVCFTLSLMAKPLGIVVPPVLVLLDIWPLNRLPEPFRFSWPTLKSHILPLILEKIPFGLFALVIVFFTRASGKVSGGSELQIRRPSTTLIWDGFSGYVYYIKKLLFPTNLAIFYDVPLTPYWLGLLCLAVLVCVSGWVVVLSRHQRAVLVGWLWFGATLLPMVGFANLNTPRSDRYAYFSFVGLFLIVVWGGQVWLQSNQAHRKILQLGLGLVMLACIGLSWAQTQVWKNNLTLFQHAVDCGASNFVTESNLGVEYLKNNQLVEAEAHLKEAYRLDPSFVTTLSALGRIYEQRGQHAEAIKYYEQALRKKPDMPDLLFNYGNALVNLNRGDDALEYLQEVLKHDPKHAKTYCALGTYYFNKKLYPEAIQHYSKAIELQPDFFEARLNLANVLTSNRDPNAAIVHLNYALGLHPESAIGFQILGNALNAANRPKDAIDAYQKSLQRDPNQADVHYRLAILLNSNGKQPDAIGHLQTALKLKPGLTDAKNLLNSLQGAGKQG